MPPIDSSTPDDRSLEGLDAPAVDAWLAEHTSLTPPCRYQLISGGQSNLTFEGGDTGGTRFVLRRPPLGAVLQSAHDMGREFRIMSALEPTAVPVPAMLGNCEDTGVNEAPFYVMGFTDGLIVRDQQDAEAMLPDLVRGRVGGSMMDALADLHLLDVDAIGLGELGRHDGYVARQLKRWSRQYEASTDRSVPALDKSLERLSETIPEQSRVSVVHGDYRMDNCVLTPDGEVAAVLDWELCTLGEPLADVGMLLLNWPDPDEPTDNLFSGTPTKAGGFIDRDAMVARYGERTGLDLGRLSYFIAFSQWKLACIVEGIRARRASGQMGEERRAGAEDLKRRIDGLAEAAWARLQAE